MLSECGVEAHPGSNKGHQLQTLTMLLLLCCCSFLPSCRRECRCQRRPFRLPTPLECCSQWSSTTWSSCASQPSELKLISFVPSAWAGSLPSQRNRKAQRHIVSDGCDARVALTVNHLPCPSPSLSILCTQHLPSPITPRIGRPITMTMRIGLGFFIQILALVSAAIIEMVRYRMVRNLGLPEKFLAAGPKADPLDPAYTEPMR